MHLESMNQQVKWESEIPWIYFSNLNTEPLINSLIEQFDFLNDDIIDNVSFLNKLEIKHAWERMCLWSVQWLLATLFFNWMANFLMCTGLRGLGWGYLLFFFDQR